LETNVDWNALVAPLIGLALVWLARFLVSPLVQSVKEGIPLPPPSAEASETWKDLVTDPKSDKSGAVLGDLERILFFIAFWLSSLEIVVAWLAFKVAAKWEAWSTTGALPDSLPGADPLPYLVARRRWSSQRLMSFLVGTLANVLVSFACVLIGKHLQAWCA
jgi:hypothetical protein